MEMFLDLIILLLVVIALIAAVIVLITPQIYQAIHPADSNETIAPSNLPSGDSRAYLGLKELSCQSLENGFVFVTRVQADASVNGFKPSSDEEALVMDRLIQSFHFDQTNRTYSKGDRLKLVETGSTENSTTIWKDGRIYRCSGKCTMDLMDEREANAYYDMLYRMRHDCAYLGRTPLPDQINQTRLLQIKDDGIKIINGFSCRRFLISADKAYAGASLRNASLHLDERQKSLLWNLAHLHSPIEECLDTQSGILIQRRIQTDLKSVYDFRFDSNGSMILYQQTDLTYYSDSVPDEFFALPQ